MGTGGGGLRSASVLDFLRTRYDVQVASFTVPHHSKNRMARVWRNGSRLLRGVPPLIDRFSGFEDQLALSGHYKVAVLEHFWCAPYAEAVRPYCDLLVLDLHNVESELAATHARAAGGLEGLAHRRFAARYRKLESRWIPKFDMVLATSEEDRRRIGHPNVLVYPNALPVIEAPEVEEENCIVFSGNLEYHPNMEAVRWFAAEIWPVLRKRNEGLTWKLVGRNAFAIDGMVKGDSRIRIVGAVEDAVAEIARARVVVVPLLSGSGTRFKILEAWAAQRAVVSTAIGAEGLGASDGKQLLIADDAGDFSRAVQVALDDPGLRKRMGGAGRRWYLEKFTWPVAWEGLARAGI